MMKAKRDKATLATLCVGCKYGTIASGSKFVCNRPDMGAAGVAAAVVDTFFGDGCKGYEPTEIVTTKTKTK